MNDWVIIAEFYRPFDAVESEALLKGAQIPYATNDIAQNMLIQPIDMIGSTIKLRVLEKDAERALELLHNAGITQIKYTRPDAGNTEKNGKQSHRSPLKNYGYLVLLILVILLFFLMKYKIAH